MDKRFWAVLGAIIIIFVGIIVIQNRKASAPDGSSGSGSSGVTNHVEGKNSKGITLVEYGDYECPVCYLYYSVVKQVAEKYNDQIQFQFRNFPLQQMHPNAFAGARAAEAAALQNKFWEMHDQLYENQDPNGATGWVSSKDPLNQYFAGFAKTLGLNVDQFKKDYASSKVNDAINADAAEGNKLGITGTPTFFLDGKEVKLQDLVDGNQPSVDKFSKVIDQAIADKK